MVERTRLFLTGYLNDTIIKKVNSGNPIVLKNIDKIPADFTTGFDDVDKYKLLLEE